MEMVHLKRGDMAPTIGAFVILDPKGIPVKPVLMGATSPGVTPWAKALLMVDERPVRLALAGSLIFSCFMVKLLFCFIADFLGKTPGRIGTSSRNSG
jgi:hypothetical protein